MNYELVNYCEIDKYASKAYSLIHEVSEEKNLGDITLIESKDIDDVTLVVGGSPCFTKDTLVLTNFGYKNINDVCVGDYVLDHTNHYSRVENVLNQGKKEIWQIKAMGSHEINTTENHKFYVREKYYKWDSDNRVDKRLFKSPIWLETNKLSNDYYIGISINKNEKIPTWEGVDYIRGNFTEKVKKLDMNDKNLWYIAGRYLGDGWTRIRKRENSKDSLSIVTICCGKHKYDGLKNELDKLNFHYSTCEERTAYKFTISNKELAYFLSQFGRGAKNKKIPSFVFDLPVDYILEILRGYWDADGCIGRNGLYKASSISKELIYGLGQLIAKAYHKPYSIYYTKRKPTYTIEGRVVNQNNTYSITFKKDSRKQDKAFYEDGYLWCPIHSVTKTDKLETVYDLTIENSHSFTANGAIAHNCQDFSMAGKKQGVKWICNDCGVEYNPLHVHYTKRDRCPNCESENIDKTRSSLLIEYLRMIREKKPKIAIYENVKNIIGKQFKESFEMFLKELDEYNYNSYYSCLNSKNYGIPQNRERIFVVIVRKDVDNGKFRFPKGFKLDLRLKDLLETNVDEKYFLSKAMKNYIANENEKWTGNNDKSLVNKSIASTINTKEGGRRCDASNYIVPSLKEEDVDLKSIRKYGIFDKDGKRHQAGSVWDKAALAPTLDTAQGGYRMPLIEVEDEKPICVGQVSNEGSQTVKVYSDETVSQTLCAGTHGYAMGNVYTDLKIRRLTPKECWRLMGFKDKDVDICIENKLSDTQLYKMAGNSIVVDVLYYIFLELFNVMPHLFEDLKILSLFSGIGAFEKALEMLFENDINK